MADVLDLKRPIAQTRRPLPINGPVNHGRPTAPPKVALVHDWFPGLAGGERVTAELARAFPGAPIHTLFDFLSAEERAYVTQNGQSDIITSRLNNLPGVRRYYRMTMLACTRHIERFDLRDFDCVISSSAAFAKGVITSADQPHIAYIHSPPRYAYDLSGAYIDSIGGPLKGLKQHVAHRMLHKLRMWDQRTINMVDMVVANSRYVARRIWKTYRRRATVVHPPIDTDRFALNAGPRSGAFVAASRLVSYKRLDVIVDVFSARPDLALRVVGDGPEMAQLRRRAAGNVTFVGAVSDPEMVIELQQARALVFAADEDFGMLPVEAQSCGTPVIAYGKGGVLETVRPLGQADPTGVFFDAQSTPSLQGALDLFIDAEGDFDPHRIRAHALGFDTQHFQASMKRIVDDQLGRTS